MIEGFLAWWAEHLLGWVPAGLRAPSGPPDGIVARLDGSGATLVRRQAGRTTPLGTLAPDAPPAALRALLGPRPGRITLALPPASMLRRPVELPLAAERDLGQVLHFEMDRLTPFNATEVDWTWSVLERDKARGRVRLALLLAPRAVWAPWREAFAAAGLAVAALEGGAGTIPLAGGTQGGQWRRTILRTAAIGCALLAGVAVAAPFVRQTLESRQVEQRIQALRPDVDKAEALRRRIASGIAGADVLATQRETTGEVLSVVALVTDILPDDTYLTELGWHARVLTMTGQSGSAPRLIEALSREPTVRNPTFAAPVTRDEAAKVDRFSIRAEIVP